MATVDNKKHSEMDASDFNATGMQNPFSAKDATAAIKAKLAKKLGFKTSGQAPFEQSKAETLKKKL